MDNPPIEHASRRKIARFHSPGDVPGYGSSKGLTLKKQAKGLLEALNTPGDVCERISELIRLLILVDLQPYFHENMSTALASDFNDFHLRTNWPVLEIDNTCGGERHKDWKGITGLRTARETAGKGDQNISGWDVSFSRQLHGMRNATKNGGRKDGVYEPTGEVIGRRDLLKQLIGAEGFPEELARRLRAGKAGTEKVTEVTRLAVQAIESAEKDPVSAMQYALGKLIGMPYRLRAGKNVDAVSACGLNERYDPAELEKYIILSWMQTLPDELKSAAAAEIVKIFKGFAKGNDSTAARLLVGFSENIFEEYDVGLPSMGLVGLSSWIDLYEKFPEENDALWSALLGQRVSGIGPVLRQLIGESGRSATLTVEDVKGACRKQST